MNILAFIIHFEQLNHLFFFFFFTPNIWGPKTVLTYFIYWKERESHTHGTEMEICLKQEKEKKDSPAVAIKLHAGVTIPLGCLFQEIILSRRSYLVSKMILTIHLDLRLKVSKQVDNLVAIIFRPCLFVGIGNEIRSVLGIDPTRFLFSYFVNMSDRK